MAQYTLTDFHDFLGRPFTDLSMLEKALTAPGAEGDKEGDRNEQIKYEGNRILAQIGNPLLQLAVKSLVLEGVPRGIPTASLANSSITVKKGERMIFFNRLLHN